MRRLEFASVLMAFDGHHQQCLRVIVAQIRETTGTSVGIRPMFDQHPQHVQITGQDCTHHARHATFLLHCRLHVWKVKILQESSLLLRILSPHKRNMHVLSRFPKIYWITVKNKKHQLLQETIEVPLFLLLIQQGRTTGQIETIFGEGPRFSQVPDLGFQGHLTKFHDHRTVTFNRKEAVGNGVPEIGSVLKRKAVFSIGFLVSTMKLASSGFHFVKHHFH